MQVFNDAATRRLAEVTKRWAGMRSQRIAANRAKQAEIQAILPALIQAEADAKAVWQEHRNRRLEAQAEARGTMPSAEEIALEQERAQLLAGQR